MRVFMTGASGFVGSAVVQDLIASGHEVVGLARSDEASRSLVAAGAQVHRGELENLDSLRSGAADSDGVIHCGFIHDFSRFLEICEVDRLAIEAMGDVLAGSHRPLVITSGTGMGSRDHGQSASEDHFDIEHQNPRKASELAGVAAAERGANVSVVRLPQVHDPYKQGLITYLIGAARETGVSAYVGNGKQRWPAVHRLDAAPVYRLALEKAVPGARYHAVAEEGIAARKIAEVIGKVLDIPVVSKSPEEAGAHFGWLGMFMNLDMPASSALTQERLGWHPTHVGLISDLEQGKF